MECIRYLRGYIKSKGSREAVSHKEGRDSKRGGNEEAKGAQ